MLSHLFPTAYDNTVHWMWYNACNTYNYITAHDSLGPKTILCCSAKASICVNCMLQCPSAALAQRYMSFPTLNGSMVLSTDWLMYWLSRYRRMNSFVALSHPLSHWSLQTDQLSQPSNYITVDGSVATVIMKGNTGEDIWRVLHGMLNVPNMEYLKCICVQSAFRLRIVNCENTAYYWHTHDRSPRRCHASDW